MRSISKYVDGHSIAADVRMQRQVHKGSFALLEGSTDYKRFKKSISLQDCNLIICYGKPNVINATQRLCDDGFAGVVGFIDQDFDVILGRTVSHENIISSKYHDFDVDVLSTTALSRYLEEVVDPQKLPASWDAKSVLTTVMEAIRPLSALRYASVRARLFYKLNNLVIEDFFDGAKVDKKKMIDCVFQGVRPTVTEIETLDGHIIKYEALPIDLYQLTSGHDLCTALGIRLREHIGHRKIPQTYGSEIELHLRLAVTIEDLAEVGFIQKVTEWEIANAPYKILIKRV